jgi:hypothetical protein
MRPILVLAAFTALSTAGFALAATPAERATAAPAPASDPTIAQPSWKAPKTAWGAPDLSGYWTNATITPTTRNLRLTDKATLSAADAHKLETAFTNALDDAEKPTDPNSGVKAQTDSKLLQIRPEFAAAGGDVGGYNAFWIDPGTHIMEVNGQFRTSIVTTPDGQVPKRKDGAATGFGGGGAARPAAGAAGAGGGGGASRLGSFDSYEYRGLGERCIMGFGRNAGPPMLPNGFYNNDYYILQTPDSVVIEIEMIHDARIVRLGAQHRTDGVRPWMGDSIGHYEGATLVVETTNIPRAQAFMGAWKTLKVTEWFTRVSPTRINYRFQIEDPDSWAAPWGGEYDFSPMHGIIYEYACHEGNYALPSILAGARRAEKEAASSPSGKPGA